MTRRATHQIAWNAATQGYELVNGGQGSIALTPDADQLWHTWLEQAPSFVFVCRAGGTISVCRDRKRRGGHYWVAYRRIGGKTVKRYLGRTCDLHLDQLERASHDLNATQTAPRLASPAQPGAHQAVTPAGASARQLLATKLLVPGTVTNLLLRPRLDRALAASLEHALTVISAPAGFGKTTAVAGWVRRRQANPAGARLRVAWLTLDEADNQPERFWSYLFAALDQLQPGVGALLPRGGHLDEALIDAALRDLINALLPLASEDTLLLTLDDYHLIGDQRIHAALGFLVDYLPPQLHLLLVGRGEPGLALARLRGRGRLLELGVEQLRCSETESATYLHQVVGVPLPEATLHAVIARFEGWFAGLQLFGLWLRRQAETGEALTDLSIGEQPIFEYLLSEVVHRQPPELQTFLRYTCVLDHLSPQLCEAVLDLVAHTRPARPAGQALLDQLVRNDLFVTAIGGSGPWYRYHGLFADALRSRLAQREPTLARRLQLWASRWYADQGNADLAIRHALRAGAWDHAADLIDHLLAAALWEQSDGEPTSHAHMLAQLPDSIIRARPRLGLALARSLVGGSPPEPALSWLDAAEHAAHDMPSRPGASGGREDYLGQVAIVRARQLAATGAERIALTLADSAVELLAPANRPMHAYAAFTRAQLYCALGPSGTAVELAEQAAAAAIASNQHHAATLYLNGLVGTLIVQCRLREARQQLQRLPQLAPYQHPGTLWACVWEAEILREWGELAPARTLAEQAAAARRLHGSAPLAAQSRLTLARVALAQGRLDAAEEALDELAGPGRELPRPLQASVAATLVRLWLARGNPDRAMAAAGLTPHSVDTPQTLAQEVQLISFAQVLLAQRQATVALQFLPRALGAAQAAQHYYLVAQLWTVLALAYRQADDADAALVALNEALHLTSPEGCVQVFVDAGPPMEALLRAACTAADWEDHGAQGRRLLRYVEHILGAFVPPEAGADQRRAPRASTQDSLSIRELQVLRLLARGATNQEIGATLSVSVNTVKRHLGSIFAKLRVHNRTQAVVRAQALNLADWMA